MEQIFGRLRNEEFESSLLVGEHRIGKTSLLKYLANPKVRSEHGLDSARYGFVYVDLQLVDQSAGPDRLWRRLLPPMRRECRDLGVNQTAARLLQCDQLDAFDLDELFQCVDDSGQHVVFMLDEFERITTNTNFGPDFYYGLRSLMIQHKVALVTSSRLELIELCHSDAVKSSPFFNIFANIRLRVFSPAECELLVKRTLAPTDVAFSEPEMEAVTALAGMHPYFLQVACNMLYASYEMGLGDADRRHYMRDEFRAQAVPQLVNYWDNSTDYEKILLTAAAMLERTAPSLPGFTLADLQRVFARAEPWLERLSKRGLLVNSGGRYRLFSTVAGPWILAQLAAELSEEQSYQEWLAQHQVEVDRVSGKNTGLKELLPKIGPRYRNLIITWASDPQTLAAMAGLLKSVLSLVS